MGTMKKAGGQQAGYGRKTVRSQTPTVVHTLCRTFPLNKSLEQRAMSLVALSFNILALYRPLSRNAETKDFARLTSHPVRG